MKRYTRKSGLIFRFLLVAMLWLPVPSTGSAAEHTKGLVNAPATSIQEMIAGRNKSGLAREEQTRLANEIFFKIYQMPQSIDPVVLEKKIALYCEIINQYPDAPLAQESYWNIIKILINRFRPARKTDALHLYNIFARDYPDSPYLAVIRDTMMRFLHRSQEWRDLLRITESEAGKHNKKERLKAPMAVFMHSEALFHLADRKQAVPGYTAIIEQFPDSRMARIAAQRLTEIKQTR